MRPGMIEVTGVSLEALVRAAYNPSRAQGLGHLHFQPGDLTDEEVAAIVGRGRGGIYMDYVKGRSCKFNVTCKDGRLYIDSHWYDHSDRQVRELLTSVGLSTDLFDKARADEKEHHDKCTGAAVAFLKEQGGSYTKPKAEYETKAGMENIESGFYYAQDRGLVKSAWNDAGQVWSLAA